MKTDLASIMQIYGGSDGEATKRLYALLEELGPAGKVAINLFRAQKASARAKVYRGGERGRGSYRGMAYDRKDWALGRLCEALAVDATRLGLVWGWGIDPKQDYHRDVLYVDLPTGQVSFHTTRRLNGPDYAGAWDGVRDASPGRIVQWVVSVLNAPRAAA